VIEALQITILGVLLGGLYALMASGLTMIYGVMQIINLAHGAFMVLAAYIAFFLFRDSGVDPFVSILVTAPTFFILGMAVYTLLFRRLADSPRFGEITVLLSFGLALTLEGTLGAAYSGIYHRSDVSYSTSTWDLGSIFIPKGQAYGFMACFALFALLWGFLYLTRPGYAIRATMQNRDAAQVVGVNVTRISTVAFAIGTGLAGAAGSLMSYLFTFHPAVHWQWIALLLSLIVVGGLGSLAGAVVAGIGLAVVAAFITDWLGPTWSYLTFYLSLFVVLLVRPQGLFGKASTV
jgi:branched-chain amino acid transport system permease protein